MVHFLCISTVREGVHECMVKELERREDVGKFGGLVKVLTLYSNHCALGIQPGPAPTDLLVLLIPGHPAQVITGVDLSSEATG